MSLSVTSNPDKLINGVQSNVNAAITQLPYNFKREDDTSITQTRVTALKQMLITIADETLYAVGDACYYDVVSASFTGNRVATIESIAPNTLQFFADDTLPEYATEPSTGYLNIVSGTRGDYAVELFVYKPSQAGNLFIDFGSVVTSYMENIPTEALNYRIQYRENYTGVDNPYTNDVIILALLGERGIGQVGGSNMWNYLLREPVSFAYDGSTNVGGLNTLLIPVIEGDVRTSFYVGMSIFTSTTRDGNDQLTTIQSMQFGDVGNGNQTLISLPFAWVDVNSGYAAGTVTQQATKADVATGLFLTHFKRPKKWNGWQQTASVVMDTNYTTRTGFGSAQFIERAENINEGAAGTTKITQFGTLSNKIFSLIISDSDDLPSPTGDTIVFNRIAVREADIGATVVSQFLRWEYSEECKNPIMVTWVNSLGIPEYYLFNIEQDVLLGSVAGLIYEPAVQQDVENVTKPKRRINADETLRLFCTASNVTQANIRALHEIKTAEDIEVYLTKDGSKKIGVTVSSALETAYNTRDSSTDFTVAIDFPEDYDFFSIKEY
jgi:hypothetical protein